MAGSRRGFQGMPADMATLDIIEAGDLSFAVEYRHVGSEEGPSVHIFGKVDGTQEEILRFDCFNKAPTTTMGSRTWIKRQYRLTPQPSAIHLSESAVASKATCPKC